MNKFTPGPWTVKDSNVICSDGMSPTGANSNIMDTPSRNFANAHLIAAAPDMYEALEAICSEYPASRDGMDGIIMPLGIKAARSALKKARGES